MATNTLPAKISCVEVYVDDMFIGYINRIAKRGLMQVVHVSPSKKTFSQRDANSMRSSARIATSFITATGKTYYPSKNNIVTKLVEAWSTQD